MIAGHKGEEDVEVALAAMAQDMDELTCESAVLLYHLTVLLQNEGLPLADITAKLQEHHITNKLTFRFSLKTQGEHLAHLFCRYKTH